MHTRARLTILFNYFPDEMVKRMLSAGIAVDVRDSKQVTALHVAVVNNHPSVVELLLASGADVNARDDGDVRLYDDFGLLLF